MDTIELQNITKRKYGQNVEKAACEYLQAHGLKLIVNNFFCKCGEIDLIMRDTEFLVFIEVRARSHESHGDALESITLAKQRRVIRTAKFYLQENDLYDKCPCRFDVIAVKPNEDFLWIKNAFWPAMLQL